MTNLNDLITALEAGNYDEVLKGTRYGNPSSVKKIAVFYVNKDGSIQLDKHLKRSDRRIVQDAMPNAARCIVLEAAVDNLRSELNYVLGALDKYLDNTYEYEPPETQDALNILAATKKLVGGGE